MTYWLFKEEPDCYSWQQLEKDGATVWSGVANSLAQRHLRAIRPGDLVFFYATGDVKAVVGIMQAASEPYPDPAAKDPKLVAVKVAPVRPLPRPVTLAEIKADPSFADWELVRISRLSVMPVPAPLWRKIETMAKDESAAEKQRRGPKRQ
jgi:predicted RNA-binding protein with PUA-like domain